MLPKDDTGEGSAPGETLMAATCGRERGRNDKTPVRLPTAGWAAYRRNKKSSPAMIVATAGTTLNEATRCKYRRHARRGSVSPIGEK